MKFGTDGIRGRFGETITPEVAWALGRALAEELPGDSGERHVAVARDTRPSGPALEAALCAGLIAGFARPQRLGVFPTPGLSALLRRNVQPVGDRLIGAWAAGVMITASHNPSEDNGLKVLDFSGAKPEREFLDRLGRQIDDWLALVPRHFPVLDEVKDWAFPHYFDSLRRVVGYPEGGPTFPHIHYGPPQPLTGLKLLVDCANGAGMVTAPAILQALGAEVVALNTGDGASINLGCGSLHPELLVEQVISEGADFGIALDGDADRGVLVLPDRRVLDGDDLLWLCAASLPAGSTVVGTIMTNAGLEVGLASRGIRLERTPVGDAYIADALARLGTRISAAPFWQTGIGGEPSGHLLLSPWIPTADGLLSCILGILAILRDVSPDWPRQPQIHRSRRFSGNVPSAAAVDAACAAVRARWEAAGARIVVRPSGTEPLVRVMVEHPVATQAGAAAEELLACLPIS